MSHNYPTHVLDGYKVLDFTQFIAGPTVTRMMAQMGADVIKVEIAPAGDRTRVLPLYRDHRSGYFVQQNLGKRSLCLDVKNPAALAILKELVAKVDVVVENFAPGVIARMGLDYETVRSLNPRIVMCSVSTFGQQGPLAHLPGYDFIAQAYSGVTSMIGEAGGTPYIPLVAVGDVNTGVHGALAIVSALRYRDRTGKGQHLDVGLLDVYYHCHEVSVHQYSGSNGKLKPSRQGPHLNYVAPAGVFKANGGWVVIMSFLHHWKDLCKAMDRLDLVTDPDFATDAARLAHRPELIKTIEDWLATFPDRDSAIAHMQKHAVPAAPVLSIEETVHHPHLRARGTVRTIEDPIAGSFDVPGMPLKFSEFPQPLTLEAATLGQHNGEVLHDLLGRSDQEIEELRKAGVLTEGKY
jgi:CoA:oxalate CoA-transferase